MPKESVTEKNSVAGKGAASASTSTEGNGREDCKSGNAKDAAQCAFRALAELEDAKERFASSLQELNDLGEPQAWIRDTFGLSLGELRSYLTLARDDREDTESSNGWPEYPASAPK